VLRVRKRVIDRLPVSPERRARVEWRWDQLPRPRELRDMDTFRAGRRRHIDAWTGGYTMLSSRRGRALHRLARDIEERRVPGDLVDCGVWNGGSSILLGQGAPSRKVWSFDSFEGLPVPGPLDGAASREYAGECVGAEAKLRQGFAALAPATRYEVRRGWFEDTLPAAAAEIEQVAILHCDGDWYDSVRLTLECFYAKVSPGGYIVIDDYGTWPGAQRATDEFRARVHDDARLVRIDHTGRYWRKRG
jgi:O-methyltransferase